MRKFLIIFVIIPTLWKIQKLAQIDQIPNTVALDKNIHFNVFGNATKHKTNMTQKSKMLKINAHVRAETETKKITEENAVV